MIRLPSCAALAASALLAACAALAPPARAPGPFDLIGRVAVSYDGRAFSSNVRWHHLPKRDEIWLLTPAGQTLAHIVSDDEGATLTGANGSQYSAADVESLTRQGFGWELPLTHLGWWVQGEAAPGTTAQNIERDERARLVGLTQDGWQIRLVPDPLIENGRVPRRLELADGRNVIRLVIDGWRSVEGP
jgi:outer membrane lipoprotein LolB